MANAEENRKSITENMSIVLFNEVGGLCPKCNIPLMNKGERLTKLYEVAHIYPHSPRANEAQLLKDEERLSKDVDDLNNLIALCKPCHKIFDNPRTIAGYREMVDLKKELQRISRLKDDLHENKLDQEFNSIIQSLADFRGESTSELSLEAIKVDEKSDDTLHFFTKQKIKNNVKYFYKEIQDKFAELDKSQPYTSDTIFSQVKTYYCKLRKSDYDQSEIFDAMTKWIMTISCNQNREVSEIFVSFFIQNCEVYS